MSNPFAKYSDEGLEKVEDRVGGGYAAKDTDIYTGNIKQFYAGKSSGGADSVTVILSGGDFGNKEYRETLYTSNKNGENSYAAKDKDGKETGKRSPLPGYTHANHMCIATVGKKLSEIDFEDKMVNIYDPEQQKELPKSVPVAIELIGQEVSVAILKTKEFKTEKDAQGNYAPKADGSTREVNTIEKVFNTKHKMTISEAENGATEPQFWNAWLEKNKGTVRDKTAGKGGNNGNAGAPQASGSGEAAPRESLFK